MPQGASSRHGTSLPKLCACDWACRKPLMGCVMTGLQGAPRCDGGMLGVQRQTGPEQGGKGGSTPCQTLGRDRGPFHFWLPAPAGTSHGLSRVRAGQGRRVRVGRRYTQGAVHGRPAPHGPRTQTAQRTRHPAFSGGLGPQSLCVGPGWATGGSEAPYAACPWPNSCGPAAAGPGLRGAAALGGPRTGCGSLLQPDLARSPGKQAGGFSSVVERVLCIVAPEGSIRIA